MNKLALKAWTAFLLLSLGGGAYCLYALTSLPSDGGRFLGYSLQRFAVILAAGGFTVLLAAALFSLQRSAGWTAQIFEKLSTLRSAGLLLPTGAALILLPQVVLDVLQTLYRTSEIYSYMAYASRLAPVLNWLSWIGVLLTLTVLAVSGKAVLARMGVQKAILFWAGGIFLFLLLVGVLVAVTGTGIRRDSTGSWGMPTVPLLEWQIFLAAALTLLVVGFSYLVNSMPSFERTRSLLNRIPVDLVVAIFVWVVAAGVWNSQPLIPAYFATPGRAPNFEVYPFSDGATYDQYAQSILIGNGMMGNIPQRALYIVFLAGLHLLAGQRYQDVILAQTLVLAFLPALLYLIGKELHSRPAGILTALLFILREVTAIHAAPFTDNITNSKLYFSELPAALCLALSIWLFIRWLKDPGRKASALAAGGALGMAMLIRTQSFILFPAFALVSLLVYVRPWRWKIWLAGLALTLLGLTLAVSPWLWRNTRVAGGLTFDNSASQTQVLAQRYNGIPFDVVIPHLPKESESAYSSRLLRMAVTGILKDPGSAANAVLGHWVNNEISNVLLFPIRFEITHPGELIWPESSFWQSWSGMLTPRQGLLLAANLAVLAVGFAAALKMTGPAGLIPLAANLAYNLSTAVFRSSGERFLVPVDWVAMLYFAIGLAQCAGWILSFLCASWPGFASRQPVLNSVPGQRPFPLRPAAAAALAFLVVGFSMPLAEVVFPQRYPEQTRQQAVDRLFQTVSMPGASPAWIDKMRQLALQPDTVVASGRALYPRFYAAGEHEPKTAKTGFAGMDFSRLLFYQVGQKNGLVVLPLNEPPAYFPNTSDVTIIGCSRSLYIEPLLVVVGPGNAVYSSPKLVPARCSLLK